MDGSDDTALKLTKILVCVDFAILPLRTQNIFGLHVALLMESDMLSYKIAKMMTPLYPFLNPLCGQSHNSSGSFEIQKWLSCWLAQGHNKNHCKELIPATFNIICSWHIIGDWHSFLVRSPSWHSSVSPLLQTNSKVGFFQLVVTQCCHTIVHFSAQYCSFQMIIVWTYSKSVIISTKDERFIYLITKIFCALSKIDHMAICRCFSWYCSWKS